MGTQIITLLMYLMALVVFLLPGGLVALLGYAIYKAVGSHRQRKRRARHAEDRWGATGKPPG